MRGFFTGLTAGLAAGIAAQMMIAKNHEQMLELVKNFPRNFRLNPNASIEELIVQKEELEELIRNKEAEASYTESTEEEEDEVVGV